MVINIKALIIRLKGLLFYFTEDETLGHFLTSSKANIISSSAILGKMFSFSNIKHIILVLCYFSLNPGS